MLSLTVLVAQLCLGHGLYPLAYQLEEVPTDAGVLLAGTNFGALLSTDDGASWSWICEESIGYGNSTFPVWRVGSDGAFWAADVYGLYVSRDSGCTWTPLPDFVATGAADLWQAGQTLLAATGKYGATNVVLQSTDLGLSWQATSLAGAAVLYTSVRAAPAMPSRVYVGAWWFTPTTTMALERSDDTGATYTHVDLTTVLPAAGRFRVAAVSPVSPDTLWAILDEQTDAHPSHLLRSTDQGDHWLEVALSTDPFGSVALAPDGHRVWAATAGVAYVSTDDGQTFSPLASPPRQACAETFADRTYLCGSPAFDGFAVERSVDGGAFAPLLTWPQVSGVLTCPAGSLVTTRCPQYLAALEATFPPQAQPDAGVAPDAGTPGAPPPVGCRCDGAGGLLALAAMFALRRWTK